MKRVLVAIFLVSSFYINAYSASDFCSDGTIEDVTNSIVNNDFNDEANGWDVTVGYGTSTSYTAHGQLIYIWDNATISQVVPIEPNTEYQLKFLGAYTVKKGQVTDPSDSTYKGQAVRVTYSNGVYTKQEVRHWAISDNSLAEYTLNLGDSGDSTSLTIKGCAGGCTGNTGSFLKLDYFRLYKCNKNTNPPSSSPKTSVTKKVKLTILNDDVKFLAKDGTSQKLHTKIVNNNFSLNIHSVDENKNDIKNTVASEVKARLIPSSASCLSTSSTGLTPWVDIDISNKTNSTASFISPYANKSVKVQIKWKNVNNQELVECCSTDLFAIRPDRFKIVLPSSDIKAGEEFDFKIIANDKAGNPTNSYNETKDISFRVIAEEKKFGCSTGTLKVTRKSFINGNFLDDKATYDNVGDLNITVEEIPGREFAIVDKDDTPDEIRYITKDTISKKFIPAKLSTIVKLTDAKSNITFYASDPSVMAANLNLKISATTNSGAILSNYTNSCYAKDNDIKITYTNSNTVDTQTIKSDKNITQSGSNYFKIKIAKSSFTSPTVTEDIKINLDRNPQVAKNPNLFTITQVEINDGTVTTLVNPTTNNKAHFYYSRAHVPSPQTSDSIEMQPKVYYEIYCKGCNKSIFTQAVGESSIDSVYWYILPSSIVNAFGTSVCDYKSGAADLYAVNRSLINSISHQDFETIKIRANKVPSKNKIYYEPVSSFMQYHEFGTALPKHYFDISFTTSNSQWAGEGKVGTTVDTTISKKSVKSLEW